MLVRREHTEKRTVNNIQTRRVTVNKPDPVYSYRDEQGAITTLSGPFHTGQFLLQIGEFTNTCKGVVKYIIWPLRAHVLAIAVRSGVLI